MNGIKFTFDEGWYYVVGGKTEGPFETEAAARQDVFDVHGLCVVSGERIR